MLSGQWQIGLDIQPSGAFAVALTYGRGGWQLRRWWRIAFSDSPLDDGVLVRPGLLLAALTLWRRQLPLRHQLRVGFPAWHTLQQQIALPAAKLRESRQGDYLVGVAARRLQMSPDALCWDYQIEDGQACLVTARQPEVHALRDALASLRLHPCAIVPDACALAAFLPLAKPASYVVYRDDQRWLWAGDGRWGGWARNTIASMDEIGLLLEAQPEELALCAGECADSPGHCFNPWMGVARRQPPLPVQEADFSVALGLAMGKVNL